MPEPLSTPSAAAVADAPPPSVAWVGGAAGHLVLLDQTRLPVEVATVACRDVATVVEAIQSLRVRGAPAIGIAAAYGVVLAAGELVDRHGEVLLAGIETAVDELAASRPTAVNLFWALARMQDRARDLMAEWGDELTGRTLAEALLAEAVAIHDEDRRMCRAIGRHGAALIAGGSGVLTHCNTGGLATSEYGTALAVLLTCQDQGKPIHVYVDETRPLLQGARLTAWELAARGVDATLICDSMAGQVMKEGRVQAVITGADRIAANGDSANKIGTYGLAVLAKHHGIPFYVAAPSSTFDLALATGETIPIEQRAAAEITHGFGRATAPEGIGVYNPAFDVTPASLITALITERGVIEPVTPEAIRRTLGR